MEQSPNKLSTPLVPIVVDREGKRGNGGLGGWRLIVVGQPDGSMGLGGRLPSPPILLLRRFCAI
jgi:hypothetical protein